MEVISRILSSMSAAWVSWVMLVMLVLMAFNRFFVTDMAVILRGLFSRSERLYLDSTWQGRVVAWLYRAGIIAMALYMLYSAELDRCSFAGYIMALGWTCVLLLVQYVLEKIVGVVFLSPKQSELVFDQKICISNAITMMLWVVVLVMQWMNNLLLMKVLYVVLLALYIGVLLLKSVQIFYRKVTSIFYILLYIVSLEVVPVFATASVIKYTL